MPGYLQAPVPPPKQTSTGFIVAIIVAVVLVAVCVGAGLAIVQKQQGKSLGPVIGTVTVAGRADAVDDVVTGKGD